jgi:DNA-binding MarR family transcriptional regulator
MDSFIVRAVTLSYVARNEVIAESESTAEELVLALSDAERRVTRRLSQVLAHHDCTTERWRALTLLSRGEGHSMSELADFTQLPPASLTRLVDGLVGDNLVHRKADARDRRRVIVHIAPRGRALQRRLSQAIAAERDAIFADVGELQLAQLFDALADLAAALR